MMMMRLTNGIIINNDSADSHHDKTATMMAMKKVELCENK